MKYELNQVVTGRQHRGLGAVIDAQFVEDIIDVRFNGVRAD